MATAVIPPRYAVRNYLRQQMKKMESLTAKDFFALRDRWATNYRGRPNDAAALSRMADEFVAFAKTVGGFGFEVEAPPTSKASPNRNRIRISCQLADPLSFRLGWDTDPSTAYAEPVILLRRFEAELRPKKAVISFSPNYVALTRHTLERIYERTEVEHDAFADLIHSGLNQLLDNFALSHAASLSVAHETSIAENHYRAIPYENGLLIMNSRIVFDPLDEGSLGFRLTIPDRKFTLPFINAMHRLELGELGRERGIMGISVSSSLTYIDIQNLGGARADYYYAFMDFAERLEPSDRQFLRQKILAPEPPHIPGRKFLFKDELQSRIARVDKLLRLGWLTPANDSLLCSIEAYDP